MDWRGSFVFIISEHRIATRCQWGPICRLVYDDAAMNVASLRRGRGLWTLKAPSAWTGAGRRTYATQTGLGTSRTTTQTRRKAVTTFNDDGRIPWGDLTAREKMARTTQQSFNFTLIIAGGLLTVSLRSVVSMSVGYAPSNVGELCA